MGFLFATSAVIPTATRTPCSYAAAVSQIRCHARDHVQTRSRVFIPSGTTAFSGRSFFSISTPATKIFRSESTRTQCSVKKEYTSFEEMLEQSDKPILVDFYATWCGPCQMMVPILEEVNEALKEKMRVVKIDTDKYPSIATKYGIGALPTLMLFKGGNPIDKMEGVVPSEELISRINKLI